VTAGSPGPDAPTRGGGGFHTARSIRTDYDHTHVHTHVRADGDGDRRDQQSSMISRAERYPYAFHIALDGNGVNGLEGLAGVCLFHYDPATGDHAYKIVYYDGIAGGHAVSVNPAGTVGFLGNAGQHLLFYDADTLDEIDRISTLRFEPTPSSLQGSTHLVWLDDDVFVTAVGDTCTGSDWTCWTSRNGSGRTA
jgi:hypothetical protein